MLDKIQFPYINMYIEEKLFELLYQEFLVGQKRESCVHKSEEKNNKSQDLTFFKGQ